LRFCGLADDQIQMLHDASLEIMARTGMRFFDEEALGLFRRAGAQVLDGNLVRIPARLVDWALRSAPKCIEICDQLGEPAMSLGGRRSYFGVGSDCMNIYDPHTGARRKPVLQDVVHGVRLVDSLPNLDFVMSMFLPTDVPESQYERYQMLTMLQESTKPIVFVGMEDTSTVYAIEMACAVAGDLENLQRSPFVVNYVNVASCFRHNETSVRRLLYAAERDLPSIYAPSKTRGGLAPITEAGALALGNAGQLAGLVLSQLKREGSPFIRSFPGGDGLDLRTMVSLYVDPDGGPFGWDLARHYGIPTFGIAGCSDAKVFDAQAAAEATLKLVENALNGVNLIHDIGYLDSAMTGSPELVVLCDEIIGWLRRYCRELEITEETLALDEIHALGPDGHFLESAHTLRHIREDWRPTLMDRSNFHRWAENGSRTLQERANQKVLELIAESHAPALPGDVRSKIETVLRL
jgi:trimethylamine--corrinoid protein Co-methyltransferase